MHGFIWDCDYVHFSLYRDSFIEMASDKHLDAEWKRIQQKTFTRWCNEHLKAKLLKIEDLNLDLRDGVRLVVLLELLSQKKLGRYNKKARIHVQKMENCQLALDFITKKERIKLVNIGKGGREGGTEGGGGGGGGRRRGERRGGGREGGGGGGEI